MRIVFASILLLTAAAAFDTAKADPYPWCAEYTGGALGGAEQLLLHDDRAMPRHSVRVGGYCTPNPFYSGPPVRARRRDAVPATIETGLHAHRRCMILVV